MALDGQTFNFNFNMNFPVSAGDGKLPVVIWNSDLELYGFSVNGSPTINRQSEYHNYFPNVSRAPSDMSPYSYSDSQRARLALKVHSCCNGSCGNN